MSATEFAFRAPPDRGGPVPVTVLDTTCEGVWLLQGLCGVEVLPAMLVLRPWVSAGGPPVGHPGVAILKEAGAVLEDDTVHPRIAAWMEALGAPDIELCGGVHRGEQHLRLAVVRRGDLHVAVTRCDDDVTIEEMGGVSSLRDLVTRILPLTGAPVEPARFEPVTVGSVDLLSGLGEVVRGEHTPSVALAGLGLTAEQRRILMLAADAPQCELSLAMLQHHAESYHLARAAVTVTDTAEGRLVSGPILSDDGTWLTQISPGTEESITRALRSLVTTLPVPAWRDHSRT
jgi:hypothetical protein